MKTAELIGPALDWAVAKCEGFRFHSFRGFLRVYGSYPNNVPGGYGSNGSQHGVRFAPSTDWSQGGPIIEREKIDPASLVCGDWRAQSAHGARPYVEYGPTPLIAAMRCYVASKLGDEVDVPKELL
jgi:hypothetical protein